MQVMTEVWSQGWAVSPGVGAAALSGRRKGTTSPPQAEQAPLISRRAEKENKKVKTESEHVVFLNLHLRSNLKTIF